MSNEPELEAQLDQAGEHKALRAIGWFSVGMAAASLGIYLGFELRSWNADGQPLSEYGVGI
jgi:hypothetical protein